MSGRDAVQLGLPQVYESVEDAVKEVIRALGGTKKTAGRLWPAVAEESPNAAERKLLDCLNPDRPHKLAPAELVTLARWGNEAGSHALAHFFCDRAGYHAPVPYKAEDEKARLQSQAIEAVALLKGLTERLEQLAAKP